MKFTGKSLFTDVVSGKTVGIYVDRHGNEWMSDGPFGIQVELTEGRSVK